MSVTSAALSVLILIIVEDSLRGRVLHVPDASNTVLILIIVEDSLRGP